MRDEHVSLDASGVAEPAPELWGEAFPAAGYIFSTFPLAIRTILGHAAPMSRRFNTTGDCRPESHYMIPALPRLPEAPELVDQMNYFVVHAPRQTGKTTTLIALAQSLTESGKYAALHFSCEEGRAAIDNYAGAQRAILYEMRQRAKDLLPPDLQPPALRLENNESLIRDNLAHWAQQCPRPLVLIFDEIDSLQGQSLLSVLSQLRAGFSARPKNFPASVILCGLRDVRDYKAASGGDPTRLASSSPFNVKVESLKLGNFTRDQVEELYHQYTEETGQAFSPEAITKAFDVTVGQPWLVNALAREIVEKIKVPLSEPITEAHVDEAKERLILARATHLDSLVAKLMEPRVRRIIEPVVAGEMLLGDIIYDDDVSYVRDLGLISPTNPLRISNPIYKEVIVRVLASGVEANVLAEPQSFVMPDGRFDIKRMLQEFSEFWKEHGDVLTNGLSYHEAAPQLVLMAFLQRLVNGGGVIDREYGIGRGRIDLLVRWPFKDAQGQRCVQKEALELKVWRDKQKDPLDKGLRQLDEYLGKVGLETGVLVLFDRRSSAEDIETRTRFEDVFTPSGKQVTLLRG